MLHGDPLPSAVLRCTSSERGTLESSLWVNCQQAARLSQVNDDGRRNFSLDSGEGDLSRHCFEQLALFPDVSGRDRSAKP